MLAWKLPLSAFDAMVQGVSRMTTVLAILWLSICALIVVVAATSMLKERQVISRFPWSYALLLALIVSCLCHVYEWRVIEEMRDTISFQERFIQVLLEETPEP